MKPYFILRNFSKSFKAFLFAFLLVLSVLISLFVLTGFFDLNHFEVLGHSGLRSIAAIAVLGCILAAIGYNDI